MFLRDIWYFAIPAEAVKAGRLVHKTLLGEPVLFGRTKAGEIFALKDLCPHRGVPLSAGRLLGPGDVAVGDVITTDEVECPYHGWRFNTSGQCAAIPSLTADQKIDMEKIRVQYYPVHEEHGNIWIYMPHQEWRPGVEMPAPRRPAPALPGLMGETSVRLRDVITFDCHVDHAVIGLMDPAHGPFVHRTWWWRSEASIHEKAKKFGPSELGFTMLAHAPSKNSGGYKILGGKPTTEIAFQIPGLRTELVRVGKHIVLSLTTVTPLSTEQTEVTQTFYWTNPLLNLVKPVIKPMARQFLRQDHDVVMLQKQGLKFDPRLMLINDADVQAKWYFLLKKTWEDTLASDEAFVNPVKATTLHWRS